MCFLRPSTFSSTAASLWRNPGESSVQETEKVLSKRVEVEEKVGDGAKDEQQRGQEEEEEGSR
jgi:hypothetical protein